MDLSEPGTAFSGSLSFPILRALDGRSQPASASQVYRLTQAGTVAGIRRALDRLALHGICQTDEIGARVVFSLNYEHVLFAAVRHVLDASNDFFKKITREIGGWDPAPVSGTIFGSAARRDGDAHSDIDLLLVRPQMSSNTRNRAWAPRVHLLRNAVHDWTGNHLQVLDWPLGRLTLYASREEDLIQEMERDGRIVYGSSISELLDMA